jgi:hypothetical protein
VAVPAHARRRSSRGITVHRRTELSATTRQGIPVTTITDTLIDLATQTTRDALEQAINEAGKRDLIDPEVLGEAAEHTRRPGAAEVRRVTKGFTRSDSPLEREFLRIAKRARLPPPRPKATSTATASTSIGPSSSSSSKPTASATTAPRRRRPPTACATRTISSRA